MVVWATFTSLIFPSTVQPAVNVSGWWGAVSCRNTFILENQEGQAAYTRGMNIGDDGIPRQAFNQNLTRKVSKFYRLPHPCWRFKAAKDNDGRNLDVVFTFQNLVFFKNYNHRRQLQSWTVRQQCQWQDDKCGLLFWSFFFLFKYEKQTPKPKTKRASVALWSSASFSSSATYPANKPPTPCTWFTGGCKGMSAGYSPAQNDALE